MNMKFFEVNLMYIRISMYSTCYSLLPLHFLCSLPYVPYSYQETVKFLVLSRYNMHKMFFFLAIIVRYIIDSCTQNNPEDIS